MSGFKRVACTIALVAGAFALSTVDADAQPRHGVAARRVFVSYYSPFWFYDPWFGYDYQYPWGPVPFPAYRYYAGDPGAAVKFDVKPKEAEVYVDGYYAGIVDDFDGAFQRLRVSPGAHEIEVYEDGYRPFRQKIYLTPDHTFKVKHTLERLGAGDQPEARPQPVNPPAVQPGAPDRPGSNYPAPPARGPRGRRGPPPTGDQPGSPANAAFGTLSVRVQPGDAEVLIDGEKWNGAAGQDRLVIEVPEGRHTVQIQKSGYQSFLTDVQIRRGETTPLNVSLRSQ